VQGNEFSPQHQNKLITQINFTTTENITVISSNFTEVITKRPKGIILCHMVLDTG
jgi:hypothetical protein